MTKGTKIFRIIISILLGLTMLWSVFFGLLFVAYLDKEVVYEEYGITVAGVDVTRDNKGDVLGDGTVKYNAYYNTLTFDNAVIETNNSIVCSANDLRIKLVGENKFTCKDASYIAAIFSSNEYIENDISIEGDGSMIIEFENVTDYAQGIVAENLVISTDVTIIAPDCEYAVNGIVCGDSLLVVNNATVTVQNGASKYSAAVRVRGNAMFEEGTTLNISTNPGTTDMCKGLSVNGDLILGKNVTLNVSIDDSSSLVGECIRVTGFVEISEGSAVTASAKKASAIECYGSIELNEEATVTATTDGDVADISCYGAVVNYGATFSADIDALGGIHNK